MRVAITGATGLLGRNLLFEILKQNIKHLNNLEILIFSRPKDTFQASERIEDIIINDGLDYLDVRADAAPDILKSIKTISFDLLSDSLAISPDNLKLLVGKKVNVFFHVAALTDFRSGKDIEKKLIETNVLGTQRICKLIDSLDVDEIVFVGSAYSCGSKVGVVKPDYSNINEVFRNPYEKSKLDAEINFIDFARKKKIKYRVFRPTTICGRLLEKPLGRTNKYDVFYSWVAFFLREKLKLTGDIKSIYDLPIEMPIRLRYNPRGGLNIVPADYCAKVIYDVSVNDDPDVSYHVANPDITSNEFCGNEALKLLKITGAQYTLAEPIDKNSIEKLYYKTLGKIFIQYQIGEPILFDITNLSCFYKRTKIHCPIINKQNYNFLMEYAKKDYFGVINK